MHLEAAYGDPWYWNGLGAGYLLETTTNIEETLPYFIMVAIFCGSAMILFYALFGRKQ